MATKTPNTGTIQRAAVVAACEKLGLDAAAAVMVTMNVDRVVVVERGPIVPSDGTFLRDIGGSGLLEWKRTFTIEGGEA